MLGQMMDKQLLISGLIDHAARYHADGEVVSVETAGGMHRTNWAEVDARARRLGAALLNLGLQPGDRIATLAWNNFRHLEIYFGVAGAGLVCHTVNPRLAANQLIYIMNHAEDRLLFIDKTFLPIIAGVRDQIEHLEHIVLMSDRDAEAQETVPDIKFYDELVDSGGADWQWPDMDENTAAGLCYTSGTTGDPKGALYSHRSTVLHAYASGLADSIGLVATDSILPVVPMFHVNAWGIPYVAAMVGGKLVLPGPNMDGNSLKDLINEEEVTFAAGVPTLWFGLLDALRKSGDKLPTLQRTVIGGSACPPAMITTFRDDYDVKVVHAWGMTETSPIVSASALLRKHLKLPQAEQEKIWEKVGRPPYGIDLMIADEQGNPLPMDGETQGDLYAKGFWVVNNYFGKTEAESKRMGEWFMTGDIGTLDENGILAITDRSKDVIKSGGEWISSVDLENLAVAMPEVAEAAAIAARHEKWDERPLLVVVKAEGHDPSEADILKHFEGKVAKWQIPDAVLFVDELPHTATGKIRKLTLREQYSDYLQRQ